MAHDGRGDSKIDLSELLESPSTERHSRRPMGALIITFGLLAVLVGGLGIWISTRSDTSVAVATGIESPATTAAVTVPTTLVVEPLLVLDGVDVLTGRAGPEPNMRPDAREQSLVAIDGLTLSERQVLEEAIYLDPDTHTAVGQMVGTSYRILTASGIGTFPNAPDEGSASVCYWIVGYPMPAAQTTDCFGTTAPPSFVPLWSGIEDAGIYAWSGLPEAGALAVLVADGSEVLWQRPMSGVAAFMYSGSVDDQIELRVLDASGNEIARGDRTPTIPEPDGPITGYGDYSGVASDEIDWALVVDDLVWCLTEYGYPSLSDTGGFMTAYLIGDMDNFDAVRDACMQGLNLPTQ